MLNRVPTSALSLRRLPSSSSSSSSRRQSTVPQHDPPDDASVGELRSFLASVPAGGLLVLTGRGKLTLR